MNAKWLLLLVVIGGLLGGGFFIRRYIGNPLPAILPPSNSSLLVSDSESTTSAMTGKSLPFNLTLHEEMSIGIFAEELGQARDLVVTPAGTVLVSIPDRGQVVALPDANQDGQADEVLEVITGLNKPHGLALDGDTLLVAEELQLTRYKWFDASLETQFEKKLFDIPEGGRHTSRTVVVRDNQILVSVGSRCDVCEEEHEWIGSVVISDREGNNPQVFAAGLRNSVFITVHPVTKEVWGADMGRDFLGDDAPPDEINIIKTGQHYGWPYCYGNQIYDQQFGRRDDQFCQETTAPVWEMQAHSAPLGLTFIDSAQLPADWQGDLLVAYHGSWNRSEPTGYKVVRLDVEGDRVVGESDMITGWLNGNQVYGRPVDLAFDSIGSLFISDDKRGVIYKVARDPDPS